MPKTDTSAVSVFQNQNSDYIGVRPYEGSYKLFDRSGKFLGNVGRRGGGPGEYQSSLGIGNDMIDDKNGLIYLAPSFQGKIFVYKNSGKFLKEFVLPRISVRSPMFLSNNILSVVIVPSIYYRPDHKISNVNTADAILYKFDVNTGELLEKLAPPFEHLIVRNTGAFPISSQNVPGVFDFFPAYELTAQYDTLYHIDVKRNKFLPFFTVDFDFSVIDLKQRFKPYFYQLNKNLMLISQAKEAPRIDKEGSPREVWATDIRYKTSSRIKVVNDFLGNMDVGLDYNLWRFRNGYYVYCIQPEDLIADIEERLAESSCTQKDREVLKKTLSKLKEGMNNVVFIGKIKEEIKEKLW